MQHRSRRVDPAARIDEPLPDPDTLHHDEVDDEQAEVCRFVISRRRRA
jgi:hypothetical protein